MLGPGIKRKFLAGTITIVLSVGLAMTALVRVVIYGSLHAGHEARGRYMAQRLAEDSGGTMLTERYFELQMMLNDLKASEEGIAYLFVQRDDGEVLAHTFAGGFPDDLKALREQHAAEEWHQLLETGRGTIHDFSAPLFRGVGGRVHVGLLDEPIRREINTAFFLAFGGVLAAVALGSGMAAVLAVAITRPIRLLAVAVEALEKGKTGIRVPVRSDDEIGQLAAAFNSMAEARERVESSLRESERKLRDIAASLGEGILVVDTAGNLTFMNPEAERLLGWTEAELAGKHVHDMMHYRKADGSPYPAAECPSMCVAKTGERVQVDEDIYIRKDGNSFPVSHVSAPVLDDDRVTAVVIAFQDITERKLREEERERLIMEHMDALSKVKVLSGMLPICTSCKKIRDDAGYWKQIESYIHDHSEAEFSHGICPECAERLYPGHFKKDG